MQDDPKPSKGLVERYEEMKRSQTFVFFEEEELEEIADHYMRARQNRRALEVIGIARKQHPFSPLFLVMKAQTHVQMG